MQDAMPASSVVSTAYSRVTELIHRDIVEGRLQPDSRLKVVDLARQYGVSPSPIREALQQLQAEGLVVLLPNRGAVVRGIDAREFMHMMHVRAAVEGMQARICAAVADGKLLTVIIHAAGRFAEAVEAGDRDGWFEWNRRFHNAINGADGGAIALEVVERANGVMAAFRRRWAPGLERRRLAVREHDAIVSAIRARDGESAEQAARVHVLNSLHDIVERVRSEGAWQGPLPLDLRTARVKKKSSRATGGRTVKTK
ncbi:GntR family transcriptional regulator [Peristeroidobacter agariperforans]|uniref:GntR family transcriptional regulator n=1 Tax=Peristeroidobacter agariperforans TaxID=268404 RepID=UPI00101DDDB1|nr:GntR family transcriptional regulator [Peristeroidobacter agariperforans]